tara:strand:- start:1566 stop:1691 length:126 start_codon:yes stop_codon:yes gene_type:complete
MVKEKIENILKFIILALFMIFSVIIGMIPLRIWFPKTFGKR